MVSFPSVTLYDKQFDEICEAYGGKKGNACPYFTLLTLYHFLKTGTLTPEQYYDNLLQGNICASVFGITDGIELSQLLTTVSGKYEESCCTVQMLQEGAFSLEDYFAVPGKCGFLFLKNERFFAVMKNDGDEHKQPYHVWDCHQTEQYTLPTMASLIEHLNKEYNFNNTIKVSNISFDEYNSVEMVKFTEPFETGLLEFQTS